MGVERRGTECGEGGGKGLTIASLRHLPCPGDRLLTPGERGQCWATFARSQHHTIAVSDQNHTLAQTHCANDKIIL